MTPTKASSILDNLCRIAEEFPTSDQWLPILPDADDEAFAQLAEEARCDCLLTHNARHFAPASGRGIRVIAPRGFLATLRAQP